MTITTVTVSIAVHQITGVALPAGRVSFQLSGMDVNGGIVAPAPTHVLLDDDGLGTVALWPNSLGTQGTRYGVTIHDQNGNLQFTGFATVPESNCNLHAILNLAAPASVDDAEAAAIEAQASAAAASASAASASAAAAAAVLVHTSDTSAAHAASAISVSAISGRTATDVQGMLAEISADATGGGGGGGGATNLAYSASPTSGTVTSDTGTDATLTLADGTNAGLMAPAQHTKLAGIATGATANSTDATLLARANHTGTQTASTISDFSAAADARVAAGLSGYQPVDSDLTAIAALTPADNDFIQRKASAWTSRTPEQVLADLRAAPVGNSIFDNADFENITPWSDDMTLEELLTITIGNTAALASATVAVVASSYQPLDSDLTAIAALTTTSYGRAFLALADAAAGRTALGLGTLATQSGTFSGTSSGTNTGDQDLSSYATTAAVASGYQPLDTELTAWAGVATSAKQDTLVSGTSIKTINGASVLGSGDLTVSGMNLTANTFTDTQTIEKAVGATSTDGLVLATTTAATSGNQKWSPRMRWLGYGWKTNATAASQAVEFAAEVQPVQGAANPTGKWALSSSVNGGAFTEQLSFSDAGEKELYINAQLITSNGGGGQLRFNTQNITGRYSHLMTYEGKTAVASAGCYGITNDPNTASNGSVDVAWARDAAGVWKATDGGSSLCDVKLRGLQFGATLTVGTLPSAASSGGLIYRVSDSSGPVVGSTVSSGGSATCAVQAQSSAWKVIWI